MALISSLDGLKGSRRLKTSVEFRWMTSWAVSGQFGGKRPVTNLFTLVYHVEMKLQSFII